MYIPVVGDVIVAKRKVKSAIYYNLVVGPVTNTFENACEVTTNRSTEIEVCFRLYYNDWIIESINNIVQNTIK